MLFFNLQDSNAKTQRRKEMEDKISYTIIGAAIEIHRILGGPGLFEGLYESSLCAFASLRFPLLYGFIHRQHPNLEFTKGI